MKTYEPKRLLRKAIKATEKSLNTKWALKNKNKDIGSYDCPLCTFDKDAVRAGYVKEGCEVCPYNQFVNHRACSAASSYAAYIDYRTAENFMAVRRELQATLRWLKRQLPKK